MGYATPLGFLLPVPSLAPWPTDLLLSDLYPRRAAELGPETSLYTLVDFSVNIILLIIVFMKSFSDFNFLFSFYAIFKAHIL